MRRCFLKIVMLTSLGECFYVLYMSAYVCGMKVIATINLNFQRFFCRI